MTHVYHDRELSFDHPEIMAAYRAAKESKKYEKVKRNNVKVERAYALTNYKEYFSECTEAFFGVNDFSLLTKQNWQNTIEGLS